MSRPSSPTHTSQNSKSRAFRDLGDLDYGLDLTSPLSPPLPIPPSPSRSYTDELSKKSVPVPATPVIRLLAPTPEATSPRILLHHRRAGFTDEDDDEPFPEFLDPTNTPATASLPSSRYDGSNGSNASGFHYSVPWTDDLTKTSSRRHRRPSYVQQSVFEEDTSSSSSSSSDDDSSSSPCSSPTSKSATETNDNNGSKARTKPETGDEVKDGEYKETREANSSASRNLTAFRFPKASDGQP
ncbi:uncharacterized protein PG986_013827 [Apiospora aurea]|uniref:Uncharacterized protein n=1 Tax=Apiospora aurea TaxID=335848 RepID=A0ABR1PWQ5_9PEZI